MKKRLFLLLTMIVILAPTLPAVAGEEPSKDKLVSRWRYTPNKTPAATLREVTPRFYNDFYGNDAQMGTVCLEGYVFAFTFSDYSHPSATLVQVYEASHGKALPMKCK